MSETFPDVEEVRFAGPASDNPLAYRFYDAERQVLGKTMKQQLRFAVCYWHTFCFTGQDVFGASTFVRPWNGGGSEMDVARRKADAAFEFFRKLGVPFFCFHDVDVAPPGTTAREYADNLAAMTDYLAMKMESSGVELLWGTANCFGHPRYAAGAATNPDPEVFAWAAHQVSHAMHATKKLGGANYVLWGGREGYETLLNTDLKREREQLGRFLCMVVEHKHAIGFNGTLLVEPKPHEPTKHQYDFDVSAVSSLLQQYGLEKEIALNVEANHATLAGHSLHHEVATAIALGLFGSLDANRGDPQLGWDTDQFPTDVEEWTLVLYDILRAGGFTTGGINFDAKLRRSSVDLDDLFYAHVGAIDTLALALLRAAQLLDDATLSQFVDARYAAWESAWGRQIINGDMTLAALSERCLAEELRPQPRSGRQEYLEGVVSRVLHPHHYGRSK
jgi:xylose isomerase